MHLAHNGKGLGIPNLSTTGHITKSELTRDGPGLVSHQQRDDGAADRREGKSGGDQSVFHLVNPGPKLVAP